MSLRITKELSILQNEHHDFCMACNYNFRKGDTTHLGYDRDGNGLFVCDSCSGILNEVVVRNYFTPRSYVIPSKEATLWRYMDLVKYISLLSKKSLYFTSAALFNDIFEGAKGNCGNKKKWDEHYLACFEYIVRNPPPGNECTLSSAKIKIEAERLLSEMNHSGTSQRKWTFINCWHENEYESEAMWNLYSKDITNAIAIKTTYSRLYEAIERNPAIEIGKVNYIDYNTRFVGINECFWYKRMSFKHENEVRAITLHPQDKDKTGIYVPVDLNILIEEIYISPKSGTWFKELVEDINSKYSFNFTVKKSTIDEQPFY